MKAASRTTVVLTMTGHQAQRLKRLAYMAGLNKLLVDNGAVVEPLTDEFVELLGLIDVTLAEANVIEL